MIPRSHTWCSHCINPDGYYRNDDSPYCRDHRGPDGQPIEYDGPNVYVPTPWVLGIVGRRFTHPSWRMEEPGARVSVCIGYDPRHGFWMKTDDSDGYPSELHNISERAIGRTYHEVTLSWGGRVLLQEIGRLGHMPEPGSKEIESVSLELATKNLVQMGMLSRDGEITDAGREALKPPEA